MFDQQDIHFYHHVHCFQQILREITFFKEERVETMMQVILKIIQRSYFGKYSFGYLFMCTEDFFEAVCPEFHSCLQVQKFTERESAQVITFRNVTQFEVFLFESHDGRTGEDNLQAGETVIAHS